VERWRRGVAEGSLAWRKAVESFAKGGGEGKRGREERR